MVMFKADKPDGDSASDDSSTAVPDFIKSFYSDLKKSSNAKQLTVGAVSGWFAGYMTSKFGKIAATAIGGSLLLIQLAKYNGYIEVDWKKFNQDVEVAKKKIDQNKSKLPVIIENVHQFATENVVLAGGFASGFLLGFASA